MPDILHETFVVSTPVGEPVVAKKVYRNFPIMFPNRVSCVDLVELDMLDFEYWVSIGFMLDLPLLIVGQWW